MSTIMSAQQVSVEQLNCMMGFLESHRELALGKFSRTTEGRAASKRGWEAFALQVNAVRNGVFKTASQWRQFYSEYKSRTLSKIKSHKASLSANGGEEHKPIALSDLQWRLYNILGADAGEPQHGAQHDDPLEVSIAVAMVDSKENDHHYETTRSQASSSSSLAFASVRPKSEPDASADESAEDEEDSEVPEETRPGLPRRYSHYNDAESAETNGFAEHNNLESALTQLTGLEQSRTRLMEAQNVSLDRNTRAVECLTASVVTLAAAVTTLVEEIAKKRRRDEE